MRYFLILFIFLMGCSPNNVEVKEDLDKYFTADNTRGCFALLSNSTGNITVYNLERYRDSAYLPASTFKIVNSLIGLQTGGIESDSMVIKWDGVKRPCEQWNRDLNNGIGT
jgi:beta-lactamase class D